MNQYILFNDYFQLACGGIFGPTTSVIAHWFSRKRGFAMGLVAVGSSVGGTVIPIAAHKLIPIVGLVGPFMFICSFLMLNRIT